MNIFPIGIATGDAFCNRVEERKLLAAHINNNRHTVLISTRRYGKTSLINQTLLDTKYLSCIIDMTMATSKEDAGKVIVMSVMPLINALLPKGEKIVKFILKLFSFLNPEITLKLAGQSIKLNPNYSQSADITIVETLRKLDELAEFLAQKIVIVFDEFQAIGDFRDHNIEANIRSAMQYSKNVCYIFSGSNRHLIQEMFTDKARPFFNSCEILKLKLISKDEHFKFIQNEAKKKWDNPLKDDVINTILSITELHTNYVNKVCGHFWTINEKPTTESVQTYWKELVEAESYFYSERFTSLSKNQRKLLYYFAYKIVTKPMSNEVCRSVNLSPPSLRQAYQKLLIEDYVAVNDNNEVYFIDPGLKSFIKKLYINQLNIE